MITTSFIDHFLRLQATKEASEVVEICSNYLENMGFHTFNYGFADTRNKPAETAPVEFITTCKGNWIDHYSERRYDLLDPGVESIRRGSPDPTFMSAETDLEQLEDNSSLGTYLDELIQAGGRSVIIAPLRSPFSIDGGGFAGIGLMSSLAPAELSRIWAERSSEILLFINSIHEKMSPDVRRRADQVTPLSPRERECLILLSSGYRPQEIADRLMITLPTVNLYVRSMRKKLCARTNAEAAAKSLYYGLL